MFAKHFKIKIPKAMRNDFDASSIVSLNPCRSRPVYKLSPYFYTSRVIHALCRRLDTCHLQQCCQTLLNKSVSCFSNKICKI